MPPTCKACCSEEEWFKFATRPGCLPCSGPACCTRPLLVFVKDSSTIKDSLDTVLSEAMERQKTTYKAPPGSQAYVIAQAYDSPIIENMGRS